MVRQEFHTLDPAIHHYTELLRVKRKSILVDTLEIWNLLHVVTAFKFLKISHYPTFFSTIL